MRADKWKFIVLNGVMSSVLALALQFLIDLGPGTTVLIALIIVVAQDLKERFRELHELARKPPTK